MEYAILRTVDDGKKEAHVHCPEEMLKTLMETMTALGYSPFMERGEEGLWATVDPRDYWDWVGSTNIVWQHEEAPTIFAPSKRQVFSSRKQYTADT